MGRETEGKEKSTSREPQTIRNIQRLSSRLQRAITSGHSSPRLLKDLDEFISHTFASQMERIVDIMEEFPSKEDSEVETTGSATVLHFVPRMRNLQASFKSMNKTYSSTLKGLRKVSSDDLASLADIDSELGTSLAYLLHKCSLMTSSRLRRGGREIQEIREILESMEEKVARKRKYALSP